MKRSSLLPRIILSFALAALFTIGWASAAFAHGTEGITITPATAMPGDTVTVNAAGVSSPNGDVTITIVGNGVNTVLPMQKASDDGDFEGQVTLPSTLVAGTYQLQVQGDKGTQTGDIDISGGTGSSQTGTPLGSTAPAVQPRERPLQEMILLAAIFGVLAGTGLLFARTANRRAQATL